MKPVVAIVAAGNMGAGLARVLTRHGVDVLTNLSGRSGTTRDRAAAAGMRTVSFEALADADVLLSVLPPVSARSFAQSICASWRTDKKILFVDCNAVSPDTARSIGKIVTQRGHAFVDAGIIGLPPADGRNGPRIYAAGAEAGRLAALNAFGLDVIVLEGAVGAASALKMSFAGISKGLVAVAAAMMLAATREGVADALGHELSLSDPMTLAALARRIPDMLPKAYRWVAEMREIAAFAGPEAPDIYEGAATLYERIATGHDDATLREFFARRAG